MTIDALMSCIAYFHITPARAKEVLSRVVRAVEGWRKAGHALGMTDDELDPPSLRQSGNFIGVSGSDSAKDSASPKSAYLPAILF